MADADDVCKISAAAAEEVHRQAELCLLGTLQLALAQARRATTMAAVFGAGAIAVFAAIVSAIFARLDTIPFTSGAGVTSFLLFVAALLCGQAARSSDFHVAGNEPRLLPPAAKNNKQWLLQAAAKDVQQRIDMNRAELMSSDKLLNRGILLASAAVGLGALTYSFFGILLPDHHTF
jgi:hypothetical protein